MSAGDNLQGKLFSGSVGRKHQESKHPGQLNFHEWSAQPSTVFHGSFRADWQNASAHVGTHAAASDRLLQVASNLHADSKDMPAGGRLFARRMTEPAAYVTQSDSNLNVAQWAHESGNGVLRGMSPSEEPDAKAVLGHLQQGNVVGYRNAFEDQGSTSYLAPPNKLRAWHQDVKEAQSKGLPVHPQDAHLSAHQFDPEIAVRPSSFDYKSDSYMRQGTPHEHATQGTLFPASVKAVRGETLFPIHHADRDKDAWGTPVPGMGARERAQAHADQHGGTVSFGVRQGRTDLTLPDDSYRLRKRR